SQPRDLVGGVRARYGQSAFCRSFPRISAGARVSATLSTVARGTVIRFAPSWTRGGHDARTRNDGGRPGRDGAFRQQRVRTGRKRARDESAGRGDRGAGGSVEGGGRGHPLPGDELDRRGRREGIRRRLPIRLSVRRPFREELVHER